MRIVLKQWVTVKATLQGTKMKVKNVDKKSGAHPKRQKIPRKNGLSTSKSCSR
jgi:hypothetical protein